MKDTDLAYLAGIFDGEGAIGYYSAGTGKRRRLTMTVKMTDEPIVRRLHAAFGGGFRAIRPAKVGYKPLWRWTVSDRIAREAYKQLEPYLTLKRLP